ncbi:hypothetical protein ACFY7C_20550 [Streptomyces sp. NPDC012769]
MAQSAMQVLYARTGGPVKTEEGPVDTRPARAASRPSPRSGTWSTR